MALSTNALHKLAPKVPTGYYSYNLKKKFFITFFKDTERMGFEPMLYFYKHP
jgi:hypothetical protein